MVNNKEKMFVVNFTGHKNIFGRKYVFLKSNSLPVLMCLRLFIENEVLKIISTNLENTVIYSIPVKSEHNFDFLIDGKFLLEIIKNHKKSDIAVFPKEDIIVFLVDEMTYTYRISSKLEQFPNIPTFSSDTNLPEIDYLVFYSIINRVVKFVSSGMNRPIFNGVYFRHREGNHYVVATDGKKIYEEKLDFEIDKSMNNTIISASFLHLFLNFKKLNANIKLYNWEETVVMEIGNITFISHLIQGRYADYTKAFAFTEDNFYTNFKFKKALFMDTLNAMKKFVSFDTFKSKHKYSHNQLIISSSARGEWGVERKLKIENDKTTEMVYAVNINYFILCLNAFDKDEEITMRIPNTPNIPLLFSCDNRRALLMTLRMI